MITHQSFLEAQVDIVRRLKNSSDLENIAKDSRQLIKDLYGYPKPSGAEIAINVNNICNLECKHCYYANTHRSNREVSSGLSNKEWERVLSESIEEGFSHFSIIGKEPLLNANKTRSILEYLDRQNNVIYEIITNGILVRENIGWLKNLNFDFFSISFDGYKGSHDFVRGNGSYQISRDALELLHKSGVDNLTVSHTVMPHNIGDLDTMLKDLTRAGAKYFSISFCFPTDYNDQSKVVDSTDVFQNVLKKVKNAPQEIDISINLSGEEVPQFLGNIITSVEFEPSNLAVTSDYSPAIIVVLNDLPRTAIQLGILPIQFYSGFRIDYGGTATGFCDEYINPGERHGFGNVRNQSVKELWTFAKEELWKDYTVEFYRKIQKGFNRR